MEKSSFSLKMKKHSWYDIVLETLKNRILAQWLHGQGDKHSLLSVKILNIFFHRV